MPRFLTMPDLEAAVSVTIRDAGFRAYSSIPTDPEWPIAVVQRVGGAPPVREYLDMARIQIDVWGGARADDTPVSKGEILDMIQDIRVALFEMEGERVTIPDVGDVFISGVDDSVGVTWLPDERGRDRYFVILNIYGRSMVSNT